MINLYEIVVYNELFILEVREIQLKIKKNIDGGFTKEISWINKKIDEILNEKISIHDFSGRETLATIFVKSNLLLFYNKLTEKQSIDLLISLILILDKYSYDKKKTRYLNSILSLDKKLMFKICSSYLIFQEEKTENIYDFKKMEIIMNKFIEKNVVDNFYSFTEFDHDYSKCPNNLFLLMEEIYFLLVDNTDYQNSKIFDLDNFYFRRFIFIELNKNYLNKKIRNLFLKFENYLPDEYLFIVINKFNLDEFINFLILRNKKLENYENKLSIMNYYWWIHKFYNPDSTTEVLRDGLLELKNYIDMSEKITLGQDTLYSKYDKRFSDNLNLTSQFYVTNLDEERKRQIQALKEIDKEKVVVLILDKFTNLLSEGSLFLGEFNQIVEAFSAEISEIIEKLTSETVECLSKDFEKTKTHLKKIINHIDAFKGYFYSYLIIKRIREEMKRIETLIQENEGLELKINNEIKNLLKLNCKNSEWFDAFLIINLPFEFKLIFQNITIKSNTEINYLKYSKDFIDLIYRVKQSPLMINDFFIKRGIEDKIMELSSIFGIKIKDNYWMSKNHMLYRWKQNSLSDFFSQEINENEKIDFFIDLIIEVFLRTFNSLIYSAEHFFKIFNQKDYFDFVSLNLEEIFNSSSDIVDKSTQYSVHDGYNNDQRIFWSFTKSFISFLINRYKNNQSHNGEFQTFYTLVSNKIYKKLEEVDLQIWALTKFTDDFYRIIYIYYLEHNDFEDKNILSLLKVNKFMDKFLRKAVNTNEYDNVISFKLSQEEWLNLDRYDKNDLDFFSLDSIDLIERKLLWIFNYTIFSDKNDFENSKHHINKELKYILDKKSRLYCFNSFKKIESLIKVVPNLLEKINSLEKM